MFIQTETTPNPATLKFLPGEEVLGKKGTMQFNTVQEATEKSPLAVELFGVTGVKAVFFGSDFISVTKTDMVEWEVIKTEILTTIMDHYVANKPIMYENSNKGDANKETTATDEDDNEITNQIKELIETRVRPAVAQDGGDIIYRGFDKGIVKLELHGACSGCPSSTMTLKSGIENMLKHYIPEVESVEAINGYE